MNEFNDERNAILYLYFKLKESGARIAPESSETNFRNYERKVRAFLLKNNNVTEAVVDTLINNIRVEAKKAIPSEEELEWFTADSRASYWLLCKVDKAETGFIFDTGPIPGQNGNSLLIEPSASGFNLPPAHETRVQFLQEKIIKNIPIGPTRDSILNWHKEWVELITKDNLFSDVNGKTGVTIDWLLKYLQDNGVALQWYRYAESTDEKIAYCYASYFLWRENLMTGQAEKELFIKKFKSALSTQKSREKKRAGNSKVLNVAVSQETHDKIRGICIREGISNARAIEYAINLAWKQKTNPH